MTLQKICRRPRPVTSLGIALALASAALSGVSAAAAPPVLTMVQFLDFCRSTTLAEARAKGDALGWRKMGVADGASEWNERFLDVNGGTLGAVTWRRSDEDGDGILSFWVADGESRHRACSYTSGVPDGILDTLNKTFGKPSYYSAHQYGEVIFWTQGAREVSFSRMNSSVDVSIVYKY